MNRYLKIVFAAFLFAGLNAAISFATPVSFTDQIDNPSSSGWTHILDDNEFTPDLVVGDTINVTDALLEIQMDIHRSGTGSSKLFQVTATGDTIFLATFPFDGSAGTVNNVLWPIDLDALSNAATVLQAINDRSFAVALSVGPGSINNIDFARLSGNATVVTPDPIAPNVPEPSTILLLGAGLMGLSLLRKSGSKN